MSDTLTTSEVGQILGVADWRIRRAIDALDVQVPRAGRYRLVPRALLGAIAVELKRRNWLPDAQEAITA